MTSEQPHIKLSLLKSLIHRLQMKSHSLRGKGVSEHWASWKYGKDGVKSKWIVLAISVNFKTWQLGFYHRYFSTVPNPPRSGLPSWTGSTCSSSRSSRLVPGLCKVRICGRIRAPDPGRHLLHVDLLNSPGHRNCRSSRGNQLESFFDIMQHI